MRAIRTCCCGCGNRPCTLTEHYEDTSSIQCPVCTFGLPSYDYVGRIPLAGPADNSYDRHVDINNLRPGGSPNPETVGGMQFGAGWWNAHMPGGPVAPLSDLQSDDGYTQFTDWQKNNLLDLIEWQWGPDGISTGPYDDYKQLPRGCNAPKVLAGAWSACRDPEEREGPGGPLPNHLKNMCHTCTFNSSNLHVGVCSDIDAPPGSCPSSWQNLWLNDGNCCWDGDFLNGWQDEPGTPWGVVRYPPPEFEDACINYCDSRPWYPHPTQEDIENIEWGGALTDPLSPPFFLYYGNGSEYEIDHVPASYYGNALGRGDTRIPIPDHPLRGAAGTNSAGFIQAGKWFYQLFSPFGILPWSPQAWSDWIDKWESPLSPQGNCTMKCTPGNINSHRMAFIGRTYNPWINDTNETTNPLFPNYGWGSPHDPVDANGVWGMNNVTTLPMSNATFHGNFPASYDVNGDPMITGSELGEYAGQANTMTSVVAPPPPGENYENWEWMRDWVIDGGKLVVLWTSKKNQDGPGGAAGNTGAFDPYPGEGLSWFNPSPYTELFGAEGCERNRSTYHGCDGINYEGTPVGSPSPVDGSPTYGLPAGNEQKCAHWDPSGDCEYSSGWTADNPDSMPWAHMVPADNSEDGNDWHKHPIQVESSLRKFAYYCAGDSGTTGAAFYTPGPDASEVAEYAFETDVVSGVEHALLRIGCQKTKSPAKVLQSDGTSKPFSFSWSEARTLIPNRSEGGKAMVGGENGCLVVWKQNGKGAVIVIYDSTVTGLHVSQVPDPLFENACPSELITPGDIDDPLYDPVECNLTPQEVKLHACNNDFWAFLCQDFLSEEGYQPTDSQDPIFWDNKGPEQHPKDNPCLEGLKAACCLPDGTCDMMDPWTCRENYGRWKGSYYTLGPSYTYGHYDNMWAGTFPDPDIHGNGWGNTSSRCCATCDDVTCAPAQKGVCCVKKEFVPGEQSNSHVCLGEDMMSHECCVAFRESDGVEFHDSEIWYSYEEHPDMSCEICEGDEPEPPSCSTDDDCPPIYGQGGIYIPQCCVTTCPPLGGDCFNECVNCPVCSTDDDCGEGNCCIDEECIPCPCQDDSDCCAGNLCGEDCCAASCEQGGGVCNGCCCVDGQCHSSCEGGWCPCDCDDEPDECADVIHECDNDADCGCRCSIDPDSPCCDYQEECGEPHGCPSDYWCAPGDCVDSGQNQLDGSSSQLLACGEFSCCRYDENDPCKTRRCGMCWYPGCPGDEPLLPSSTCCDDCSPCGCITLPNGSCFCDCSES